MKFKPPVPHEHGAWAMLYAPLIIAVAVLGRYELSVWLFLLATTAIFLAHEPLAVLVKLNPKRPSSPQIFRESKWWFAIYSALAIAATIPLLVNYQRWYLVPFGIVLTVLLTAHIYLASKREERTIGGEFLGVISLTFTAPGAYYVAGGKLDWFCLLLWALNIVYFTSSIFYVKMRVSRFAKKKDATTLTWQCVGYHVLLVAVIGFLIWQGWITMLAAVAFLPIVLRTIAGMKEEKGKLNLKRIGIAESIYTLVFVVFLVWGMKPSLMA
ncbi:MAG: YwiC-like family protein [Acidobacteria bacterium]|nr:YwiC-like family protein [Acidobacteriota bacterium]